ncbi:bestrophin-4-like isoform X1 [Centruroides vittatus]|uniref:bestrophin-4-like isoform X1 n=1 Tax=Centruroides vittatus TaxID=120091 RepID=UPI00350FA346
MTVTYSLNVSKARLCGFAKLLLRWRGSIYKLLYREMIIFCGLYYSLSGMYRYILSPNQRMVFEKLTRYCETFTNLIPLSFVLGFYITIVVGRWWQQYLAIPWPDKTSMLVSAYVHGSDERGRIIRRTLARYLSLLSVLTFQAVSTSVKKRFPTLDHVEESGLMTKEERCVYDEIPVSHGKWWVPAQWFTSLAVRARKEGRIKDDVLLNAILNEMHIFRGNCGMLFSYDWISIPLVYTQVVTLAIYTYFLATVMGRQYLDPEKGYPGHEVDLYIPIFTILQFFFYMGWLKVAEQLINPFGEDDDDFELNWCLDRNLQVSFMIVDEMHRKHPKLIKDTYWDELEPQLPYTKSSVNLRSQPHLGSAINLDINLDEAEFVPMETIMEDDHEDNTFTYNSPPTSPTKELLTPAFPSCVEFTARNTTGEGDTTSQTGLRLLTDFPGSKIINMLIGSSSENVNSVSKKDNNLLPTFVLKTPSHRSRTSSVNEHREDHSAEEKETINEVQFHLPSTLTPSRREQGTVEEQQSLIIDIPGDSSNAVPSYGDAAPVPTVLMDGLHSKKSGIGTSSNIHSPCETTKESVVQIDSEPGSPVVQSIYEPNSSQESLTQFVDSNQSTVSSYAELLQHSK